MTLTKQILIIVYNNMAEVNMPEKNGSVVIVKKRYKALSDAVINKFGQELGNEFLIVFKEVTGFDENTTDKKVIYNRKYNSTKKERNMKKEEESYIECMLMNICKKNMGAFEKMDFPEGSKENS